MLELKLRGFVTPEDFSGTDAERIQKALDIAKKEDIAKVVLRGVYKADSVITVPDGMHLVFEGAVLHGDLQNNVINNFSFESDRIYIEGKDSELFGNINFCHTRHVVIEGLKITGNVTMKVSRDFRIENTDIGGALTLGRGTQNAIIQHIKCNEAIMLGANGGYDIIGHESIIKNVILRDSEVPCGVKLLAADDCGFLNVQVCGISATDKGVILGEEGVSLPAPLYKNLTFIDINAPLPTVFYNESLHVYNK